MRCHVVSQNQFDDKLSRRAQDSNYFRSVGMLPIFFQELNVYINLNKGL